ncbi:heterokaryon incompatibility protein-domain-containing protein, partial [Hyaloscypha sp. PMI_1271]
DEIRIELNQASKPSIDAPPQYEALSYTWGGQTPTRPVICNNGLLLITENAFSSIRRLRCHFEPRKLWIDTICINQALAMEKTTQVAMVAEIYSKLTV